LIYDIDLHYLLTQTAATHRTSSSEGLAGKGPTSRKRVMARDNAQLLTGGSLEMQGQRPDQQGEHAVFADLDAGVLGGCKRGADVDQLVAHAPTYATLL
jgi:hypothetical protein